MTGNHILIYGLAIERFKYVKKLRKKGVMNRNNLPFYIDHYNDQIADILKNMLDIWDTKENFFYFSKNWDFFINEKKKDWGLWEDYYYFTQINPKNELKHIYKKTFEKKYPYDFYQHVIRGCKIGLDIAKINPKVEIHFCLDKLVLKDVISKADNQGKYLEYRKYGEYMDYGMCGTFKKLFNFKEYSKYKKFKKYIKYAEHGESATSKELRYIYRNWEKLKEKVIFIHQEKRVEAPWEKDPKAWEAYQPKSWQKVNHLESQKENEATKVSLSSEEKRTMVGVKKMLNHVRDDLHSDSTNLKRKEMTCASNPLLLE